MTTPQPSTAVPVCYRHPSRETYVRCTRCDRPICPDCMTEASVGHQCPDCVREGSRSVRTGTTVFGGSVIGTAGIVTKTLVGMNIAVALVALGSAATAGMLSASNILFGHLSPLHEWGALIPLRIPLVTPDRTIVGYLDGVAYGDFYRLLTSMFLHFGLLHLAMNMYALWILGRELEAVYGPLRFLAIYLVSGFGGSVAVYMFSAPDSVTAGASGAIFGLFGAYFVTLKRLRKDTSAIIPVLIVNIIFTLSVPGISVSGHFGGLVTGALVGAGLAYAPRARRNPLQAATVAVMSVVLVAIIVGWTAVLRS